MTVPIANHNCPDYRCTILFYFFPQINAPAPALFSLPASLQIKGEKIFPSRHNAILFLYKYFFLPVASLNPTITSTNGKAAARNVEKAGPRVTGGQMGSG